MAEPESFVEIPLEPSEQLPLFDSFVAATYLYGGETNAPVRPSTKLFHVREGTALEGIFKHADAKGFANVLILEPGVVFSQRLADPYVVQDIATFVGSRPNPQFTYSLGCLPMFGIQSDANHFYGPAMAAYANVYTRAYRQEFYKGCEDAFCYYYREPLCFHSAVSGQEYATMYCVSQWWPVALLVFILMIVAGASFVYFFIQNVLYLLYLLFCPFALCKQSSSPSPPPFCASQQIQHVSIPAIPKPVHDPMFHLLYFTAPTSLIHGPPSMEPQPQLPEQLQKLFANFNVDDLMRL